MDPYEILGIPRGATRQEASAAYRRLAKELHPDAPGGDRPRFERLKAAYDAVAEAAARSGEPRAARRGRPAPRRRKLRREIQLDVPQALAGCVIGVGSAAGPCGHCGGEGTTRVRTASSCATCDGTGVSDFKESGFIRLQVSCPDCAGTGKTTRIRCEACMGLGSVPEIDLQVAVPPGMRDGDELVVEGGGSDPAGNVAGDLVLTVRVSDPRYRVRGDDVETDVPVEIWEAALGCEKRVTAPDGRTFRLAVPPGSSPGRRFVMRGLGFEGFGERGDFVAVMRVRVPNASSGSAKEAFERLRDALS